ncbi:hypothetical protein BDZ89DRAFT_1108875 [Hymenopellis radicata]|nr:hypothetical protein BDZ89DRAFT_1108875 [Hymenopellis radicata]
MPSNPAGRAFSVNDFLDVSAYSDDSDDDMLSMVDEDARVMEDMDDGLVDGSSRSSVLSDAHANLSQPRLLSNFESIAAKYTASVSGPEDDDEYDSDEGDEQLGGLEVAGLFDEERLQELDAANDESRPLVRYSFNLLGTAHIVARNLREIHKNNPRLPFDISDAWLIPAAGKNHLYILVDFRSSRLCGHTDANWSLPLLDQFLRAAFTTINVDSRSLVNGVAERLACLRARRVIRPSLVGKWVLIEGGTYNRDVGLAIRGDYFYDVLVVPRVVVDAGARDYDEALNDNGKRRPVDVAGQVRRRRHQVILEEQVERVVERGGRPKASLLAVAGLEVKKRIVTSLCRGGDLEASMYLVLPGKWFAGDLQIINCRYDSLKVALSIRPSTRLAFLESQSPHINKSTLPAPAEWRIYVGDAVEDTTNGLRGRVCELKEGRVWADCTREGEDTLRVELDWSRIIKTLEVGDFVQVCYLGSVVGVGWVLALVGKQMVDLMTHIDNVEGRVARMVTAHRNSCQVIDPRERWSSNIERTPNHPLAPVQLVPTKRQIDIPAFMLEPKYYSGKVPWEGREVLVVKGTYKGRRANVVDVNLDPKDKSGLKLLLRLYGPSSSGSGSVTCSYTWAIDVKSRLPLRTAFPLSPAHIRHGFSGKNDHFIDEEILKVWRHRVLRLSRIPPIVERASTPAPSQPPPLDTTDRTHWALLPVLHGHTFHALWTESVAVRPRPIVVGQVRRDSDLLIYRRLMGGTVGKQIPAAHLTPKNPGRKADKAVRWMCVRGPWKGTFWRGIQYSTSAVLRPDDPPIENMGQWVAFQVRLRDGQADEETGVQDLILDEDLLVLDDSPATRKLNAAFAERRVGSKKKVDFVRRDAFTIDEVDK